MGDAVPVPEERAKALLMARVAGHDIDEAVMAAGLRTQGAQQGGILGQAVRQCHAEFRRRAEHPVVQRQAHPAGCPAGLVQVLGALGEQVVGAVQPERRLALAMQAQAPDLVLGRDRQADQIAARIQRMALQLQGHLDAVVQPFGAQGVNAAVILAAQLSGNAGRNVEEQRLVAAGLDAEMQLHRLEQRGGLLAMPDLVAPEAVAGDFQTVAAACGAQRPFTRSALLAGGDLEALQQAAIAGLQVQALLVGIGLPGRLPADPQRLVDGGLQVQRAVTNARPLQAMGNWLQAGEQYSDQSPSASHTGLRRRWLNRKRKSLGRISRVLASATPLSRQYSHNMPRVSRL